MGWSEVAQLIPAASPDDDPGRVTNHTTDTTQGSQHISNVIASLVA